MISRAMHRTHILAAIAAAGLAITMVGRVNAQGIPRYDHFDNNYNNNDYNQRDSYTNQRDSSANDNRSSLPAGTVLPVRLDEPLSSKNNSQGDKFSATVIHGSDDAG